MGRIILNFFLMAHRATSLIAMRIRTALEQEPRIISPSTLNQKTHLMKILSITKSLCWLPSALFLVAFAHAQSPEKAAALSDFDDLDWPQSFETSDGFEVAIHQPQVHGWTDYRQILLRAAVAVKPKGSEDDQVTYGALTVEAATTVDKEERVVFLGERKITSLNFPNAKDEATEARYKNAVESVMNPTRPMTMNLDRVLANADRYQQQNKVKGISVEPPPIFFSSEPSILVIFLGPPKFEKIDDSRLFFATNTNWDILLDPRSSHYYLLAGDGWLSTKDVMKGPWVAATKLPDAIGKLPKTDDWKDVLAAVPAKASKAPKVFVSDRPAELILTKGKPEIAPISGTKILYLANSESDVFMVDGAYYLLTAGRWFSAKDPKGPWQSAMDTIPEEFSKIPEDHDKAHVLASVPGSPDAEEAIIAAQVPQTAKVNRKEAKVEVKYEGDPQFVLIEDTTVQYAINTPNDVFLVDQNYYCCHKGVWFEATAANGPWTVCSVVPQAIYTIPASSPKHNVTYVYVYDSDDNTVTTGYTSGYNGAYVMGNLLVFGAGLWLTAEILDHWDDHYHHAHWHYHSSHWSYGCGARYSWHHGGYYRENYRAYGPYGGAGYGAVYNPWSGGYARAGRVYGPRGTGFAREAYNPWTNTYGARVGVSTPYGSWGRSVVARDDEWMRAGHRSGARGTVKGIETSKGGKAVKVDRRIGSDSFVGKTKNDNLYAGRDGNIYRRDENGDWNTLKKDGWNDIERPLKTTTQGVPSTREGTRSKLQTKGPSTQVKPSTRPSVQRKQPSTQPSVQRSTPSQLERDHSARQRGSSRTTQSRSARKSSSRGGRRR